MFGSSVFARESVKTKCPKCKSLDFLISEEWSESILSTVENGVMPDCADDHIVHGPISVECRCNKCGHWWKPRGAKTVADIIKKANQ